VTTGEVHDRADEVAPHEEPDRPTQQAPAALTARNQDAIDTAARNAIGEELRRARDTIGWTRAELATRLPFGIHIQTLAGYERGAVQCSTSRFTVLCETMGVSAADVLAWAMQRAGIGLPTTGMQVDLHAVINDKTAVRLPLRRWARTRLKDDPGTGIARLAWPVVQEMATLFGMDRDEFVRTVVLFTPCPVPQRR
jgi:transcriptional regulator with XRE-family HTH domain